MTVFTAECDRMFSVDESQTERFKSVKPNKKKREKAKITLSKISPKITIGGGSHLNEKS